MPLFPQLCATKQARLYIKEKNAYVILRELHKWERDPKAKLACQKLCELLISDEPDEGMEELHAVDVPQALQEKFEQLDKELLDDLSLSAEERETSSHSGENPPIQDNSDKH